MLGDYKSKLLKKLFQISKYVATVPKKQRGDIEDSITALFHKLQSCPEITEEILSLENEIETKFRDLMYQSKRSVLVGKEEVNE